MEPRISDWEQWACAQQILKQHGKRASVVAAERIDDLASRGDEGGVVTWRLIANRIEQLGDFAGARVKGRH